MTFKFGAAAVLFISFPFSTTLGQPLGRDGHTNLRWRGAGDCVVEFASTPCRTVRYHEYSFGRNLGFDRTTRSESVEAFDHAGDQSKTVARTSRRWWPLPQQTSKVTELVLRNGNQIGYIDHERRVYEAHQRGHNYPYGEDDDGQCSHTASHSSYLTGRPSEQSCYAWITAHFGNRPRTATGNYRYCRISHGWGPARLPPDRRPFGGLDNPSTWICKRYGVYLANRRTRAALTSLECGACRDWTR